MAEAPVAGPIVEIELEVGGPAQGGSCVARHDGRVVFVRHALPGERVRARITDDHGSYWRADAVEVIVAAPERVVPPCQHAGPGRCGGCDWQHASAAEQRRLKAAVVCEQFRRVARIELAPEFDVEALPGGLLGWRTRNTYAVGPDSSLGMHRHRSHQVEPVDACPLGTPGVGDGPALRQRWPGSTGVQLVAGDVGPDKRAEVTVLTHHPGPGRHARGRRPPDRVQVASGPPRVSHTVGAREFTVAAEGFWQVHPAAAETFTAALLDAVRPRPGEVVLDLYAGAGLLTAALADAVGPTGRVVGVETAAQAVSDAGGNLADLGWAEVRRARVNPSIVGELGTGADVVVLDPPRAGAGADVLAAVIDLAPRVIAYLSCDPATLARDVAAAARHGWAMTGLRGFDAFPMTHHVECLAVLTPA